MPGDGLLAIAHVCPFHRVGRGPAGLEEEARRLTDAGKRDTHEAIRVTSAPPRGGPDRGEVRAERMDRRNWIGTVYLDGLGME